MKVIKRFNNNVVLCIDNNGREVVAFGKALGFHEIPYELTDLSLIERSYYGIENRYLKMINDLSPDSLELSSKILDWCRLSLEGSINPNMLFTLADHIDFCVERYKNNLNVKMPLYFDFENLHPKEFEIGKKALKLINSNFKVVLPRDESVGIVMNILNAEMDVESNQCHKDLDETIEEILNIIESELGMKVDRSSANYARYISHMQYLMMRIEKNELINEGNILMYESISEQYPNSNKCAIKINEYFMHTKQYNLNQDELLYLIIHINRLCSREECYQMGITSDE